MADFSMKANDRRPVIRAQLGYHQADGSFVAVDLTDALRVDFILRSIDPAILVPKVDAEALIEDALAGIVAYFWAFGDTDTPGDYKGEWEAHWPGDGVHDIPETFPTLLYHSIEITADLDEGP